MQVPVMKVSIIIDKRLPVKIVKEKSEKIESLVDKDSTFIAY